MTRNNDLYDPAGTRPFLPPEPLAHLPAHGVPDPCAISDAHRAKAARVAEHLIDYLNDNWGAADTVVETTARAIRDLAAVAKGTP